MSSLGHVCLGAYIVVAGRQGSMLIWGSVCLFGVFLCPLVLEGQLLCVIQLDLRLMTLLLSLPGGGIIGREKHTQLLLVFLGSTVGTTSSMVCSPPFVGTQPSLVWNLHP